MGALWIDGKFVNTGGTTVIVNCGTSSGGGQVSDETLRNLTTDIENIKSQLDKLDHSVVDETLTID